MSMPGMEECPVAGIDAEGEVVLIPGIDEWSEGWEPQAVSASARAPPMEAATTVRRCEDRRDMTDIARIFRGGHTAVRRCAGERDAVPGPGALGPGGAVT